MLLADLTHVGYEALILAAALGLPIVAAVALAGLLSSLLQGAFQLHDPAVGHLPRFVAAALVLAALGPWIGHKLVAFAERVFALAAR